MRDLGDFVLAFLPPDPLKGEYIVLKDKLLKFVFPNSNAKKIRTPFRGTGGKSIVFLFLTILLLFTSCQEDPIEPETFGSLFGEVLNEDNLAIINAAVSTNPPTSTVLTDSLGRFAFENIKANSYTIRAEKVGFISQIETVTVFEDQTATTIIKMVPDTEKNNSPSPADNPFPANGSQNEGISLTLEWTAEDEDEDDELTFEVHLFNADQSTNKVVSGISDKFWTVENLDYETVYYWQVITSDSKTDPVNGPVWSFKTESFPDHRFVYAKSENGKFDIFSANIAFDGFQLTDNAGSNYRPRISPDRSRIAFISNIGIEPHLFVMKRDGSEVAQVTNAVAIAGFNISELDFCWSPNSTQLLYMNLNKLYRINIDGSGLTEIAEAPFGRTFVEVDWTDQGNKIAARTVGQVAYNSEIRLYDVNGNFLEEIVNDAPGSIGGPMFSIDGNYILYTYDFSEFESSDGRQLDSRVFLKNLNDGSVMDLSEDKPSGTNDLDARFSPDGSKIIFVNTNNDGISQKNIWVMNIEGEGRTLLFNDAEMVDWR